MKNSEIIEILAKRIELLTERIDSLECRLTPAWAQGEYKHTEQPKSKPQFEEFVVLCGQNEYPEVKAILEAQGYVLYGDEWEEDEDCVVAINDGIYMTNFNELLKSSYPRLTLSQLREKYGITQEVKPQQKTAQQWLEELPDGYRERALAQMDEEKVHTVCENMYHAINVFTSWRKTNEGVRFWNQVYDHYQKGTPLPSLPDEPNKLDPIQSEILEANLAFHLDDIVRFQAEHEIQIQRGADLMYYCFIDRVVYTTSMTFIHALVVGISMYQKRHEQANTNFRG